MSAENARRSPPARANSAPVKAGTPAEPRRRRSVVEFDNQRELRAALQDCTRRGTGIEAGGERVPKRRPSGYLFGDDSDDDTDEGYLRSDDEGSDWNVNGGKASASAGGGGEGGKGSGSGGRGATDSCGLPLNALPYELDWVTENMDEKSSLPQSYEDEHERLTVLNSYLLLDSEREAAFERITALCSRIFDVPISLVSLIDIGRQWFMSNRGLGDVRETSRKLAFCAHCVQSTNDLLVVPDATADPRFMNNDLVTGFPHIRFYAGAPLVCPEGYRLGTLCVIDTKVREGGLTMSEQQTLRELTAMVVEEMVRRREYKRKASRDASRVLAEISAEMLVPLEGARKSVQGLVGHADNGNSSADKAELGQAAEACLDVMGRICEKAVKSYVDRTDTDSGSGSSSSKPQSTKEGALGDDEDDDAIVSVPDLADKLRRVLPKDARDKVKISVEVDSAVPAEIVSDDMKLLRSALNYLTSSADRMQDEGEKEGVDSSSPSAVKLRFYVKHKAAKGAAAGAKTASEAEAAKRKRGKSYLVCECEDNGQALDPDKVDDLFAGVSLPSSANKEGGNFGLQSVAHSISSLGGKFGYRPKEGWGTNEAPVGNVFWFTVPLVVPYHEREERRGDKDSSTSSSGAKQVVDKSKTNRRSSKLLSMTSSEDFDRDAVYEAVEKAMANKEGPLPEDLPTVGTGHRALVIDDSPLVRDVIGGALVQMGFNVTTASDGMEGLQSLQASQYDVVFCDFLMPIYDGPDCIDQYRKWETKNRPGSHQRIVGLADEATEEDVKRATKAGMDDVLTKSSKMSDILKDALGMVESFQPSPKSKKKELPSVGEDRRAGVEPEPHDLPTMANRFRPSGRRISLSRVIDGEGSLTSVETHRAYMSDRSRRRNAAMSRLFDTGVASPSPILGPRSS